MANYLDYFTAILIGLISSGHCLSMCGGIVVAFSFKTYSKNQYIYQFLYNIGRITSYSLIAIIVNLFGVFLFDFSGYYSYYLKIFSNFILIIIGLHICNIFHGLFFIESFLWNFWNIISSIIGKINPLKSIYHAFLLGMVWGYIPCGLIYSTIIWTAGFGSITKSFMLIILFGIGTLPSMLLAGVLSTKFKNILYNKIVRSIAGSFIILFGIKNIIMIFITKECH
ncbi:MAG TPA: sulfite exporter TauE/SafE family protein [Candidatus Azoamicus sp. OHIO2]